MIFSVQCLAETMVHFRNIYVEKKKNFWNEGEGGAVGVDSYTCSVGHKVGTGKLVGIKNTYIGR